MERCQHDVQQQRHVAVIETLQKTLQETSAELRRHHKAEIVEETQETIENKQGETEELKKLADQIAMERRQHDVQQQRLVAVIGNLQKTLQETYKRNEEKCEEYEERCKQYEAQLSAQMRNYQIELQIYARELEKLQRGMEAKKSPDDVQPHCSRFEPKEGLQREETEDRDGNDKKPCLDQYQLIACLGQGAYGVVMLAKRKSAVGPGSRQELFAIKSVRKCRNASEYRSIPEKDVLMRAIGHPFLVQLHSCFQTQGRLYYVMEYAHGGDMKSQLSQAKIFSESRTRFYAAELTLAVEFLHKCGIVHRDINLDNILLDKDGHCKLTDFGLARLGIYNRRKRESFCGPVHYMAPVMLQLEKYGPEVDWWALGVVMYEMMVGRHPFIEPGQPRISCKHFPKQVQYPQWLTSHAVYILKGFLTRDPDTRLGAYGHTEDIRNHAFFKTVDWELLLKKQIEPPMKPQITDVTEMQHSYKTIKESAMPTWFEDVSAHPCNQEAYRDFTFVNPNYGAGQGQVQRSECYVGEESEEKMLNEESIKKAGITLEVTPVEELEEQKMAEEDSIVEQVEESEKEKLLIEDSIKKAGSTLEEEVEQLRALCATNDVELQKRHEEMEKAVKQIYVLEHKPVSSTWQKVFLVVGGAVLGVAFAVLMGFCPIEVEGEINYFFE